uniref:Uncharacterized protein n=1 Tax=Oryza brachyantha TaxID=4533 RepID=J3LMN6_ORYBR
MAVGSRPTSERSGSAALALGLGLGLGLQLERGLGAPGCRTRRRRRRRWEGGGGCGEVEVMANAMAAWWDWRDGGEPFEWRRRRVSFWLSDIFRSDRNPTVREGARNLIVLCHHGFSFFRYFEFGLRHSTIVEGGYVGLLFSFISYYLKIIFFFISCMIVLREVLVDGNYDSVKVYL